MARPIPCLLAIKRKKNGEVQFIREITVISNPIPGHPITDYYRYGYCRRPFSEKNFFQFRKAPLSLEKFEKDSE